MGIDRPGGPPDRPEPDPEHGWGRRDRAERDGGPQAETRSRAEYYESQRQAGETRNQAGDSRVPNYRTTSATDANDGPRDAHGAGDRPDGPRTGDHYPDKTGRGELPGGSKDRTSAADGGVTSYWYEVPRFLREWQDLKARLPDRKAQAADSSGDPRGSWRGEGGQYLSPDQHEKTEDGIAEVGKAERRITHDLRAVEAENTSGGRLVGLEFRRKGDERLKEKIADKLAVEPGTGPARAISEVSDAIRYTFRLDSANYTRGYRDIRERLEAHGHELFYCKNSWENTEYKGINTRWLTSEGQRFEVQFHTPESVHAKQEVTHEAYERIRNPRTTDRELRELKTFQREVSSWVPAPRGAKDIPDYVKEGY